MAVNPVVFPPLLNPELPTMLDLISFCASSYAFLNFDVSFSFSSRSFLIIWALSARSTLRFSLSVVKVYTFFAISYPSSENYLSSSFSLARFSFSPSSY